MDKSIKIGDHRLICGDSTEQGFVTEFLVNHAGEKIRAVITDPPYGVNYVNNKKIFFEKGGSKINVARNIEGDDLIGGAYYDFSIKWLSPIRAFLADKNQFYIFNGDTNLKELMRKLILNSTKVNEIVFDPFGGSGSTLIACEHTKRQCLMIEKDEMYCQIIIKRFQELKK